MWGSSSSKLRATAINSQSSHLSLPFPSPPLLSLINDTPSLPSSSRLFSSLLFSSQLLGRQLVNHISPNFTHAHSSKNHLESSEP
ncbi:hypothetical protein EYC84_000615 [Monilinia fructicola]|uniref:Uncharacterized protein n=1 Tax=Monilinia fructicola TaxID=38448 RepID=A0A5M9JU15_MONFR|nr:hypothetical protein EYC84_000615 [Monilinia fructicola]